MCLFTCGVNDTDNLSCLWNWIKLRFRGNPLSEEKKQTKDTPTTCYTDVHDDIDASI